MSGIDGGNDGLRGLYPFCQPVGRFATRAAGKVSGKSEQVAAMPEQLGAFFHVGVIVEDIDAAIEELSRALGLEFNEPHESTYGDSHIKVCYSLQGPPFLELIQGEPGSMWSTTGGPHADHVGYFVDDLAGTMDHLVESGSPIDIDGTSYGR